jgi:DNA polymerase-1
VNNPLDQFREIGVADFEFVARDGERPEVVSLSWCELRSGRKATLWRDQLGPKPPYSVSPDTLFVGYFASAEMGCHRSLGWPLPTNILDLYVEFSNEKNGKRRPMEVKENGKLQPKKKWRSLLAALVAYNIEAMGSSEKEGGRDLVMQGIEWPPGEDRWSAEDRQEILEYNTKDTNATAKLFIRMCPKIDFPRALARGRYMSAVSGMEHYGVPIDIEMWEHMKVRLGPAQERLIAEIDKNYGVYVNGSFSNKQSINTYAETRWSGHG